MKKYNFSRIHSIGMLIAIGAWLAVGCASPNTSGISAGVTTDASGVLQPVLEVSNTTLSKNLKVVAQQTAIAPSGFLKAAVSIYSGFNKSRTIQYKFYWMDSQGMDIQPDGDAWTPLVLHGKETRQIQGTAPSAEASGYVLRIREGNAMKSRKWLPTQYNF